MFNQHVAVQWRQAGINMLPGVAFTAASSKRTEEMHRSKSQKGRRSEGRGWGRRWIQHVAGDNMQHSVGETPFLPSLLLTHPWHGRNVQIKETSEVRMWEGVAVGIREDRKKKKMLCSHCGKKDSAITVSIMGCQSSAMLRILFLSGRGLSLCLYTDNRSCHLKKCCD